MFIYWLLCPLLLILAGTERKPLHAMVVPNSISNLEIAECIYKSLCRAPIPLELSHSTLLPHITYKKFCVPSPCFCFPLYQLWFLMHAKVSLRPGCHYCPQAVPEESQLPTAKFKPGCHPSNSPGSICTSETEKICCNYCVIKAQWFNFISLWHKICICDSHLLCREYDSTKTSSWDLVYKVVQKV